MPYMGAVKEYVAQIEEASQGRIEIEIFPQGALVPGNKELEGIRDGIVEMADTYFCYSDYIFPGAQLLTGHPGGLSATQDFYWRNHADGEAILQEAADIIGGHYISHGGNNLGADVFVSVREINSIEDVKGMKFRSASAPLREIFQRMEIAAVLIAWGEVYDSIKRGILDGCEMSSWVTNWDMGMHEVAKYHYTTPVMLPGGCGDIIANKDAWAELPDDIKIMMTHIVPSVEIDISMAIADADVTKAQDYIDYGCVVEPLPKEINDAMLSVGAEYYSENPDPFFQKIWQNREMWRAKMINFSVN
jgi:TRAP-type mannitol/chloroaromatic compound transport system substrate-binding protein